MKDAIAAAFIVPVSGQESRYVEKATKALDEVFAERDQLRAEVERLNGVVKEAKALLAISGQSVKK